MPAHSRRTCTLQCARPWLHDLSLSICFSFGSSAANAALEPPHRLHPPLRRSANLLQECPQNPRTTTALTLHQCPPPSPLRKFAHLRHWDESDTCHKWLNHTGSNTRRGGRSGSTGRLTPLPPDLRLRRSRYAGRANRGLGGQWPLPAPVAGGGEITAMPGYRVRVEAWAGYHRPPASQGA